MAARALSTESNATAIRTSCMEQFVVHWAVRYRAGQVSSLSTGLEGSGVWSDAAADPAALRAGLPDDNSFPGMYATTALCQVNKRKKTVPNYVRDLYGIKFLPPVR